jgi:precorrin-4/cobalt-precorrin-4 C11-methyltransferase
MEERPECDQLPKEEQKLRAIEQGKVYFIGAGPGDPELITVRGASIVQTADVIVYAGSLVPRTLLARAKEEAAIHDSSSLSLEETNDLLTESARKNKIVARVHTGDPALFGAIQEQIELLQKEGIPFEVVPGITAAFAAAAALGRQLTQPGGSQTLILTRLAGRTPVPESENLAELAKHHASLVIYLSVSRIREVVAELKQGYPADTPVVVAYRVGWPDEKFISATLADIADRVDESGIKRQAVIMVGEALAGELKARSQLYDPTYTHGFRQGQPESEAEPYGVAVTALTPEASKLAAKIAQNLEKSSLYLPEKEAQAFANAHPFTDFKATIRSCFSQYKEMVCVMATGIVVRLLAPLLSGKESDPAVVVVDEMGRNAISLVSGHLGGANLLAKKVADITGGQPVITTATDVQGKVSFDELAMDAGLVIENLERVKTLNMALLEDRQIGLFDPGKWLQLSTPESVDLRLLKEPGEARDGGVDCWVYVDDRLTSFEPPPCLVLRPKSLVVGVGCNRGTTAAEIGAAVETVFHNHGLSLRAIRNLATAELKQDEEGLNELMEERGWSAEYFSVSELQTGGSVPRPSEMVKKHLGVESVCEKAAMLSAGTQDLMVAKEVLGNVTVAVARVTSS